MLLERGRHAGSEIAGVSVENRPLFAFIWLPIGLQWGRVSKRQLLEVELVMLKTKQKRNTSKGRGFFTPPPEVETRFPM